MEPKLGRVAIYARFSSDKQSDASIDDQVHRCRQWIDAHRGSADVRIFTDYAVSGASLERAGVQSLLDAVARGEVDSVIAEDSSRISRDIGDSDRVFKSLAFRGVRLIGVADGLDTAMGGSSAKLAYGVKSLLSDMYLVELADKTRRGMEGRARAGLATGGLPYGYLGRRAENGTAIEVNPEQAPVVRRIFEEYAFGIGLGDIASRLNRDEIAPPRAHSTRRVPGWSFTAVRSILFNRRYVGDWAFGTGEWRKVPGTNRRLPRRRVTGPLVQTSRPDLAIIDELLWSRVHARFASNPKPATVARRSYLLSGLLRCAVCSGTMTVSGGGPGRRYFACANARGRGTCSFRSAVLMQDVEAAVLGKIQDMIRSAMKDIREMIASELKAFTASRGDRASRRARELQAVERQIGNLVEHVADTGSPAMAAKVRQLEATASQLRAELADDDNVTPIVSPAKVIMDRVLDLQGLADDPATGRPMLARLLPEGAIHCAPYEDGFGVTWELAPAGLFLADPKESTRNPRWFHVVAGARNAMNLTIPMDAFVPKRRAS